MNKRFQVDGSSRARRRSALHALLDRDNRMRRSDLDRHHRFSWFRCALSLVSYALMLSDVLRTGLGVHDLKASYGFYEPDQVVFFGPYAYPVTHELWGNATGERGSVRFWPYKYDSTSTVMRAVVQHLHAPRWPACVLYDASCDEHKGLRRHSVFEMLDSVVEAVKMHPGIRSSRHMRSGHTTLRLDYAFFDRVHHYAFPWFFFRPNRRTGQAIYYEPKLLASQPICGSALPRPYGCGEAWTNFARLCHREPNPLCGGSGNLWEHVTFRMREFQQKHSNFTVDFIVLEGMDDYVRQCLTVQGVKFYDVVTIARARKCDTRNASDCETVLVDDYRYEGVGIAVNAPNWFGVSAIIRGFGQTYAWLRLVGLAVGCYAARSNETMMVASSIGGKIVTTVRTMFLVPSQIMIYGSIVPVTCYVVAHLIDSGAVYELVGQQLVSIQGSTNFKFGTLLRVCAVSMRSVWVLAIFCHGLHWIAKHCRWSPIHGLIGVPEFVLSFIASLTILAQLRFVPFRNSRVWQVEEIAPSEVRHKWASARFDSTHGFWYRLLFGTNVDYKCLAASILLHLSLVVLTRAANRLMPRFFKYELLLVTRTLVPFGAGDLWPSNALVVSWHGTFLGSSSPARNCPKTRSMREIHLKPAGRIVDAVRLFPTRETKILQRIYPEDAISAKSTHVSQVFERDFFPVTERTSETECAICLMNLAVMTDPLTYLQLRGFSGRLVGVYESVVTSRCILLPVKLTTSTADIPIDWGELRLRFVMNTKELSWWELLQCG